MTATAHHHVDHERALGEVQAAVSRCDEPRDEQRAVQSLVLRIGRELGALDKVLNDRA